LTNLPLLASSTWTVDKEAALAEIPEDLDLGLAAIIKVDPIADPYRTRQVKYRIICESGLTPEMFPQGETQSVQVTSDTELELTVKSIRPGDESAASDESPPAEYLAATAMANHEDEPIRTLATSAAAAEATPVETAIGAEKAVREWLTKANMSSNLATASEVVRSREGDCTEHAVLLTAVLRARQVPARTVIGLVYFEPESAFAGHAWTEAWLGGRWVPLDATLAFGGIGATHIKLGDTSLADGESGLLLGAFSTWRLLDQAEISVIEVEAGSE
jgi:transglutaminase-like putative cysteine protease